MKTMTPKRHVVDLLFTIALFGVFAASALLVVLIGANVYKSTVRGMNANFNMQTSLTYVAAKVRQNDTENAVSIGELSGLPALVLKQTVGENDYHTLIYEYGGKLREIFTRADNPVTPSEGNAIMDVDSFTMEQLENGLFRFSCSDSGGETSEVTVRARCTAEAPPYAAVSTPTETEAVS